jgi:transposase
MNKIGVIGMDLAKNVFQVHGVDGEGELVMRKQLERAQVRRFFANLEPCLVGMEACGGAHRLLVRQRIALSNPLRGILSEYGLVLPQGGKGISRRLPALLEDAENSMPMLARHLLAECKEEHHQLMERVERLEAQIKAWHADNGVSQRLASIPGIGARNVIYDIRRRLRAGQPSGNPWVEQLLLRCHPNEVAVALANKMARIARVLLVREETWCPVRTA